MLNEELTKKWISALPRYQQTTLRLRRDEGFCPLGVLCDLFPEEFYWEKSKNSNWELRRKIDDKIISCAYPPPEIMCKLGVTTHNCEFSEEFLDHLATIFPDVDKDHNSISVLNDNRNYPLSKIGCVLSIALEFEAQYEISAIL